MKQIIILILTCLCWDAMANVPYYFQDYPYYTQISIVDKSKFELKTYKYSGENFKEILSKKIATGKKYGNKLKAGDEKTPEGIYFTQKYADEAELKKEYGSVAYIYGVGAWTLNYPNVIDIKVYKKTGTGIWIHGTNDPSRIDDQFSSRGCVVLKNEDFQDFAQNNPKPHPVIINEETEKLTSNEVDQMLSFLSRWKTDWELKNDNYFNYYNQESYSVEYKKNLFLKRNDITVSFDNVNILKHKDYYQVDFVQNYKDSHLNDVGFKTLYITKKDQGFQILEEKWVDLKVVDKTAKK